MQKILLKVKQAELLFSQLKDASLATTKELLESKKEDLKLTDEQITKIKHTYTRDRGHI